jgi:putative flippase GtrA
MMRRLNLGEFTRSKKIKFLTAGVLNTFFGYAAYAVLLFVGLSYTLALLLATIFGVIFNYFNFGKFVFSGHRDWLVFCRFVAVYVVTYAINMVGLQVLMQDFLLDPYVGQVICIPPSVLLSWFLMNYWVFKGQSA